MVGFEAPALALLLALPWLVRYDASTAEDAFPPLGLPVVLLGLVIPYGSGTFVWWAGVVLLSAVAVFGWSAGLRRLRSVAAGAVATFAALAVPQPWAPVGTALVGSLVYIVVALVLQESGAAGATRTHGPAGTTGATDDAEGTERTVSARGAGGLHAIVARMGRGQAVGSVLLAAALATAVVAIPAFEPAGRATQISSLVVLLVALIAVEAGRARQHLRWHSNGVFQQVATTDWPQAELDQRLEELYRTALRADRAERVTLTATPGTHPTAHPTAHPAAHTTAYPTSHPTRSAALPQRSLTVRISADTALTLHRSRGDLPFDRADRRLAEDLAAMSETLHRRASEESVLRHAATTDHLTGLAIFSHFQRRLDELAQSGSTERYAIFFADLDDFKGLNTRLGHLEADRVLQTIGRRLRSGLPPHITACRFGGDEFVFLARPLPGSADVHDAFEAIHGLISEPISTAGGVVQVIPTIGVALARRAGDSPDDAVRRAEEQMRSRKRIVRAARNAGTAGRPALAVARLDEEPIESGERLERSADLALDPSSLLDPAEHGRAHTP